MTTRMNIINLALIDLGQTPIMDEVTPPGDTYVLQYETHIGALVSGYPWTFQTGLQKLSRLTATPDVHWKYQFDLPSDMTGAPRAVYPSATRREPTTDYEIRGRRLYSDYTDLWLRYQQPLDPTKWPGYFVSLAQLVMKAQFALSVREDSTLWRELTRMVYGPPELMGEGGKLGEAKAIDASGKPSDVVAIGSNPLTAVRFS